MATTTDLEPYREWELEQVQAADTSHFSDRAKNFARARRHTVVVRLLRWVLPVAAAGVVVTYVGIVLQTVGWVDKLPSVAIPNLIPDQLAMDNPRYEGFTADGGSYVVAAKTAFPNLSDMTLVKLNEIVGDITDANKVKTNLKAARGSYNTKTSQLELFDGIDVVSDNGMHARLSSATVMPKTSIVVSKEPVVVEMPAGKIRSNEMTIRNKTREVTFLDNVTAHLVPDKGDAGKTAEQAKSGSAAVPIISAGNGPLDITANRLDVDDTKKVAVFSGSVNAVQGGAALETATLQVVYESKEDGSKAAPGSGANIASISSPTPVVLTRAPQDRVTSNRLDFDAKTEVAVLAGDVVMTSGAARRISGEVATINQRDDTILMTGNVVAVQGRNQLKGGRLFVDRATGRTQLSSPDEGGRIATRFYRDEATAGAKQAKQTTVETATAAGVFKTDPNAPIDVEADRLDVDDRAKTAVYKGDVRAKQGDFVVRTAKLTARYTGQAGLAEQLDNADKSKKQDAQVNRIEARGKVIVTSKDGQSATGDWADFDIKSNKVVLGGDVVLTQEKNVVRGTKLVIDMLTGESIIQNDPGAAWSATAEPSDKKNGAGGVVVQGPLQGGRPSAIFYPRMKDSASNKGAGTAKGAQTQPELGDGWQARSPGD